MKKTFYTGCLILIIGLFGLLALDYPLLDHTSQLLTSPEGTPLSSTYYPGSVSKGVLLLEGFGADQHMLRSLIRDLTASGIHVFTFDYPGHGSSAGSLDYDNASTDRLARQVQAAMTEFQRQSGLDATQIVWIGHSLGARVALQSAVLGPLAPEKLVLIGAQVNLGTNEQSEFFTGTQDADLPWVQSLSAETPAIPILLISGTWEDILTVDAAQQFMTKLCAAETTSCLGESPREWLLLESLFHNYEIFSPRVITAAREWAFPDLEHPSSLASVRISLWLAVLGGILLSLIGLARSLPAVKTSEDGFIILNPKKFVWAKLWLWLVALPLSALVMFLYVRLPMPGPTFNLIYGGFLGGYGLLMFLLHWFARMPAVSGGVRQIRSKIEALPNGWLWAVCFNLALFAAVTLLYRSGIGLAPPVGVRFVWVLIFTPLTALGFWIGFHEADALAKSAPGRSIYRVLATLIGLLPFYLYMGLLISLDSTSGVLSSLVGLLILGSCFLQGEITRRLCGNAWFAAILQAIYIFWLILPSGPLFAPLF